MPRCWCWLAASSLAWAALATPAPCPASVLERTVVHTVGGDGAVEETTRLRIELERAEELAAWSPYYVHLDDNRRLKRLEAAATLPGGGRKRISGSHQDTLHPGGGGALHSSTRFREVTFPPLPAGSVLELEHTVEVEPYFPAGAIALTGGEAVAALSVEVRGRPDLRWHLAGETEGLEVVRLPDGVRVSGRALPEPDPPALSPAAAAEGPVLFYSWGNGEGWPAVGHWYEGLLAQVPQGEEEVRRLARELTADAAGPRQRLAALAGFVQEKVRYVAVEVGIGGYRPSSPRETLARRWGDCKDKSLLMIDLLREAGVPAYPALVLAADDDRIEPDFPSPGQFNHLIVAVPRQALGAAPADAVDAADGSPYLFIDATQTRGGAEWLHPAVQGQDALVVAGTASALVRIPVVPELEAWRLTVNLTVDEAGAARGGAGLEIRGGTAAYLEEALATRSAVEVESAVRSLFGRLLPGVALGAVSTTAGQGAVPQVSLAAAVQLEGLLKGDGGSYSFVLPGLGFAPQPRHLAERRQPAVLTPGTTAATWKLHLPVGDCRTEGGDLEVENRVGRFRQTLTADGSTLVVERRGEILRRWAEGEDLAALQELALAEHRASRRRVRLDCGG